MFRLNRLMLYRPKLFQHAVELQSIRFRLQVISRQSIKFSVVDQKSEQSVFITL